MRVKRKVWITGGVVCLYVAALALPAAEVPGMRPETYFVVYGHEALRGGWSGWGIVPELSNIALLGAWIGLLTSSPKLSLLLSTLAFVLALTSPFAYELHIADLRLGFVLWLACPLILGIGAIFEIKERFKADSGELL